MITKLPQIKISVIVYSSKFASMIFTEFNKIIFINNQANFFYITELSIIVHKPPSVFTDNSSVLMNKRAAGLYYTSISMSSAQAKHSMLLPALRI